MPIDNLFDDSIENPLEELEIDFDDAEVNQQDEIPHAKPEQVGMGEDPNQKVSFLSYLASTREAEYQRMYDFAMDTLHFANKVQIYHWTCEKGFYHTQFEEIYNLLRNFADSLVETTFAYTKGKFSFQSKVYSHQPVDFNIDTALMKLIEYRNVAEGTSKSLELNRSISTLFDDLLTELDKRIGLLRNFQ